jgi:hypothetical protein
VADEAIYRCINDACGRPAPRRVNYCPWCGTAQTRAGARASAAAAAAAAGAGAAAALSGWLDAPQAPGAAATVPPAAPRPDATAAPAAAATPPPAPTPAPATAPSATEFGRTGQSPPQQEVPRPPLAAHPPARKPIRLRWWLLALALLWALWLLAKPSTVKIDRRIDAAIALARECKGSEAQSELIALRKSRATPEQLQRLQQGLNDEAATCTRRRQRAKAWSETSGAVEAALASASWDKARTRLQAFTRRWGEDGETRALRTRIEDARREDEAHRSHPLAAPPPATQGEGMIQ